MSHDPFRPIDEEEIRSSPEHVQRLHLWVRLLDFKAVLLKDLSDGSYIFVFVTEGLPDLLFGINKTGHLATIYSNILTELEDISDEISSKFLKSALKLQMNYPRLRINILEADNEPVRVLSNYKLRNLNMEFFAELILEGQNFLAKLNDIIEEFDLPEIWRLAENEEKKIEQDISKEIFNQYF